MKRLLVGLTFALCANAQADFTYPATKTIDHTDTYHGKVVADPYRWLEDDVRNSKEVEAWVAAQNNVTQAYLDTLSERQKIAATFTELWDFERYSTTYEYGGKLFFTKNDGLQNQSVLYVQDGEAGKPRVLIDPNTWSEDGTLALAQYQVSPKGKYIAYAVQDGGSDWRTWKVMDIASGTILDDELSWLKFNSVSWNADESGFFYARFPTPEQGQEFQSLNLGMAVYHHKLGQKQPSDKLIYSNADNPEWGYGAWVSVNGRWLVITVWHGTDNRYQVLYQDLQDTSSAPKFLVEGFDHEYTLLGSRDDKIYFQTNKDAPLGRVIAVDLTKPQQQHWQEVVPQGKFALSSVALSKSYLIAHYMEDAKSALYRFDEQGRKTAIDLPSIGSVGSLSTSSSSDKLYYSFSSFNYPTTQFSNQLDTGKNRVFKAPDVKFNPDDFVVKQVFYRSKDGTQVPMTIAHKKGLKLKGDLPTLLYGYGGFNVSLLPRFSLTRLTWMMMGGVYAQPNIRGGGEYGKPWHKAGTKLQKKNVFDDFISAGEYLVKEGYTNSSKLAVWGGSNGGLLVGAVLNQRPDLFAAGIPAVGVMDMLRFHKFTAGRYWVDDYGSSDNPEEFKALHAYSPYHNVKPGTDYPAVLVLTADTDDRVVPGHSFKYIAALQKAHSGNDPVMIRIESRAGHGAGVPTEKVIEQYSDMMAFLAANLGMQTLFK